MNRAYSLLEIRSVDEDARIIEGIATTPKLALDDMILEPRGIEFSLPVPFLYKHDTDFPLGNVIGATVTDEGIKVRIQVAAQGIADFIDEKWRLIKSGTVRGLSIRWKTLKQTGNRITKSKWIELSAVPVGADQLATITSVRSADEAHLALLGTAETRPSRRTVINLAGVPGPTTGPTMTNQEHITALENRRAANLTRLQAIQDKTAKESRSMDETESTEFDEVQSEVETIDKDLVRFRKLEKMAVATATRIEPAAGTEPAVGAAARGAEGTARSFGRVQVSAPNVEKGTGFVRYAIAMHFAQGDRERAAKIIEANRVWMDQTPEVVTALRAPVLAGTSTTSGWASQLSVLQNLADEFVAMVRPMTIIGKINGFRNIPFNSTVPRQTAGTAGSWTGQGARKPVGRLTFDSIELKPLKVAKIVVITEELERFSNPSAEAVIRRDLAEGIQETIDTTFADPTVAASANISPGSIFNGATNTASAGGEFLDVLTDLQTAIGHFTGLGLSSGGLVIVTTEDIATGLALLPTSLGVSAFPEMTTTGGVLRGIQVVTSSVVPTGVMGFFKPSEVFLADDGQAIIDVSREATVFMDDGGSPSSTTATSLWQENKVGIKAERFINWALRRPSASYYLTGVDYDGQP